MSIFEDENATFVVLVNKEEQYSIWPDGREVPLGWELAGCKGIKKECLDYVEKVWVDMRPLSLRQQMGS